MEVLLSAKLPMILNDRGRLPHLLQKIQIFTCKTIFHIKAQLLVVDSHVVNWFVDDDLTKEMLISTKITCVFEGVFKSENLKKKICS